MPAGSGMAGIPETEDAAQAETVPWAARCMKPGNEAGQLCQYSRFESMCWIERDDDVKPVTNQRSQPSGQASWHPGSR
jgi:hypothetical protein